MAELVFNALTKAVPVQYNELLGVYYNENQGITYSLEFNYLETLGYKNFDLVYRTGDRGDYGRPATTWGTGSYISDKTTTGTGNKNSNLTDDGGLLPGQVKMLSSDEIISVPEPADFTYTKAVETEVYIDTDEETVTMIYIHNYLAEVSRVGDDEDGDYITVKVPYRSVDEDTIYTTGYDEGEYVVVTVDVDDDGDSFIATVAAPETVEGNVEAVERSTQTKDTGYAVIDDVEYQYSSVTIGDVTVAARENFRDDPELNTNYRLYMDRNGYVIGYIATEDVSKNYLVVLDSDMYMSTGEAKVMLADGTIETVKLKDTYKGKVGDVPTDANNGGLERAVFSYTVDSKGVYTLGILDERTAKGETGVAFYYNGSTESVHLTNELHAVFVGRVVAARDHDAAFKIVGGGGVIDFFRTAQPDAGDIRAGGAQALGQSRIQGRAGKSGVVPDDHVARARFLHIGHACAAGQIFIKCGRHLTPHVIGFKACELHPVSRNRLQVLQYRPRRDRGRTVLR